MISSGLYYLLDRCSLDFHIIVAGIIRKQVNRILDHYSAKRTILLNSAAGGAIAFGVTSGAVARMFGDDESERRSNTAGMTSSLASIGVVVVPPLAQLLLYTFDSWRPALQLLALCTLMMPPMAVLLGRSATKSSPHAVDSGNDKDYEKDVTDESNMRKHIHRSFCFCLVFSFVGFISFSCQPICLRIARIKDCPGG